MSRTRTRRRLVIALILAVLVGLVPGYQALTAFLLIRCAIQGRTADAERLLKLGANLETTTPVLRETPLMLAVLNNHPDTVAYFLDHGADLEAYNRYANTPLLLAIRNRQPQMVKRLLDYGARRWVSPETDCEPVTVHAEEVAIRESDLPTFTVLWHYRGQGSLDAHRLLSEAVRCNNVAVAKYLLAQGVDPAVPYAEWHGPNEFHWTTPLHATRSLEVGRLLLDHGANVNLTDSEGRTALQCLLLEYYAPAPPDAAAIAKLFIARGVRINAPDRDGKTALDLDSGQSRAFTNVLLQHGARRSRVRPARTTPLHTAIREGHTVKHIAWLIARGADVNARDSAGRTPLHIVAGGAYSAIEGYPERWKCEIAALLLKHGARINATNAWGETPLHLLLMGWPPPEMAFARFLLTHGARTDINNTGGWTPAQVSALCVNKFGQDIICATAMPSPPHQPAGEAKGTNK